MSFAVVAFLMLSFDALELRIIGYRKIGSAHLDKLIKFLENYDKYLQLDSKSFWILKRDIQTTIYTLAFIIKDTFTKNIFSEIEFPALEDIFFRALSIFELTEDKRKREEIINYFKKLKEALRVKDRKPKEMYCVIKNIINYVNKHYKPLTIETVSNYENRRLQTGVDSEYTGLRGYLKNIIISATTSAITAVLVTVFLLVLQSIGELILRFIFMLTLRMMIIYLYFFIYPFILLYIIYRTIYMLFKLVFKL